MASVWGNVSDWRAPVWKICKKSDGVLHSFWKFRNFPPPLPHSCWPIPIPPPVILAPPRGICSPPPPLVATPPILLPATPRYCLLLLHEAALLLHQVRSWYSRAYACTRSRNGERCNATPWETSSYSHTLVLSHSHTLTLSPVITPSHLSLVHAPCCPLHPHDPPL
jgi:hypothetical protein